CSLITTSVVRASGDLIVTRERDPDTTSALPIGINVAEYRKLITITMLLNFNNGCVSFELKPLINNYK
ncbi:hypothetical protein, partial [Rivularia sp. UHCC 0363]|uniref:hypothetical protein n=1 Tax=Rivularia sp. UHCC 0363 TaxID=3110244 RepID=UPI002B1FED3C